MKTSLKKAPYTSAGNLVTYLGRHEEPHEWQDNKPFPEMLILDGITRGMSAARFRWRTHKGKAFEMFMTDAADLINTRTTIFGGTVDAWWMIIKRGKNFGIRIADADDLQTAGHISGPSADCPACKGVNYSYEHWCPLIPNPEEKHEYRPDYLSAVRCLCGQRQREAIHGFCDCSKETNTACSGPNCQG